MTEAQRLEIVALIDACKARGVRHLKTADLEFSIDREQKPPQERLRPLSRLKAAERS